MAHTQRKTVPAWIQRPWLIRGQKKDRRKRAGWLKPKRCRKCGGVFTRQIQIGKNRVCLAGHHVMRDEHAAEARRTGPRRVSASPITEDMLKGFASKRAPQSHSPKTAPGQSAPAIPDRVVSTPGRLRRALGRILGAKRGN